MKQAARRDDGALDDAVVLAPPQVFHAQVFGQHLWMPNRERAGFADEGVQAADVDIPDLLPSPALVVHVSGNGPAAVES